MHGVYYLSGIYLGGLVEAVVTRNLIGASENWQQSPSRSVLVGAEDFLVFAVGIWFSSALERVPGRHQCR
jgi:hypothetical protein